jgi:hypothetical protein
MTLSTTLSENTGACGVVKLITKLEDVAAASAANVRRAGATACLATWKIVRPSMLDGTGRMFGSWLLVGLHRGAVASRDNGCVFAATCGTTVSESGHFVDFLGLIAVRAVHEGTLTHA